MTMAHVRAASFVALVTIAAPHAVPAQELSLKSVIHRAGTYVTEFRRQLSSLVAEESYVQDVLPLVARTGRSAAAALHRELRSDFLLVRPAGADRYVEFRDVFEVDGNRVRDRQERLTALFLDTSLSARPRIERIIEESARFNIGTIERNVNTPTLPLLFLDPDNQPRFRFKRVAGTAPTITRTPHETTSANFTVSTEVWVIEYEEVQRKTLIRTTAGRDIPARGRFWIEPATGRVLMSELTADNSAVRATIDVSYQSEPLVGFLVPIEMRERYEGRRDGTLIEGNATYGNFRRFQARPDERIAPPGAK